MASGNDYARWDDGWTRNPPQPPARPDFAEWWYFMTDRQKEDYYAAVTGYLMAVAGAKRWEYWNELHFRYLMAWTQAGSGDMAVKP